MNYFKSLFIALVCTLTGCKKRNESQMAPQDEKRIIILGSSTAFGTGATPISSSWANLLKEKLRLISSTVTVLNWAKGGYTTYQLLPSVSPIHENRPLVDASCNITKAISTDPALVIINLPSNDIASGYDNLEALDNFRTIVTELEKRKISYIITGTQPRSLDASGRLKLKELNNNLSTLFTVNFVNYYEGLATSQGYIRSEFSVGDGVHLNNNGHKLVFNSIIQSEVFSKWVLSIN